MSSVQLDASNPGDTNRAICPIAGMNCVAQSIDLLLACLESKDPYHRWTPFQISSHANKSSQIDLLRELEQKSAEGLPENLEGRETECGEEVDGVL